MSSYEVRAARVGDAQQVAAIHAGSAQAAYQALAPQAHQSLTMDQRRAFWREAIEFGEPLLQVALEAGRIVGFCGFDRSRDAGSRPTTGEIWALYVLPTHWNQGVGRALWDATREAMVEEGCTEVTLWVPLANERALRFLEQAGFAREAGAVKTAAFGDVRLEEIRLRRGLQ